MVKITQNDRLVYFISVNGVGLVTFAWLTDESSIFILFPICSRLSYFSASVKSHGVHNVFAKVTRDFNVEISNLLLGVQVGIKTTIVTSPWLRTHHLNFYTTVPINALFIFGVLPVNHVENLIIYNTPRSNCWSMLIRSTQVDIQEKITFQMSVFRYPRARINFNNIFRGVLR